jgi:hypothetical protein
VVRDHINDIVGSFAGDGEALHVERLGVDGPIHRKREKLPELARLHVERIQDRLPQVGIGARIVVVVGEDVDLGGAVRSHREGQRQRTQKGSGKNPSVLLNL